MIPSVEIETIEEYQYCKDGGHDALLHKYLILPIKLRVEIQKQTFGRTIFGRGNVPQANQRYYHWVWEHKPHVCENCQMPLRFYSATFISHILSRGAHPELAHDPRNSNILCQKCHAKWEGSGNKTMRIYTGNQITIKKINNEYLKLNYETDKI